MSCRVRPLAIADHAACCAVWRRCRGLGDVPHQDALQAFLTRNPGLSQVAEQSGQLVGVVLSSFDGIRGYFYRLAVDPDYQRQGIARRLVARAKAALQDHGATRINLHAFHGNNEATALWQQLGWKVTDQLDTWQLFFDCSTPKVSAERC